MKKLLLSFTAVLLLFAGCGKSAPSSASSAKPTPTPAPQKTPESSSKQVHDFDPATNQVISFGAYTIQIPKDWKESEDAWYAMRNGNAYVSLTAFSEEATADALTEEFLENDLSVFGRYFTDGEYTAQSDRMITVNSIRMRQAVIPTVRGEAEGILHAQAFLSEETGTINYVLIFEVSDSPFDFSADIKDILSSVHTDESAIQRYREEQEDIAEIQLRLESAEVTFTTDVLEYSDKSVDPLSLIRCSDSEIAISTNDAIDLKVLDKQTVTYLLELQGERREVSHTFEVKDTKAPEIKLAQENVTLEYGAEYDPASNVVSVSDPVDGELKWCQGPEYAIVGNYFLEGTVNAKQPGTYEIKVHAIDLNMNMAEKTFHVTVGEQPQSATRSAPTYDYIGNANSMKFHLPGCRSVAKMKEYNKVYFTGVTRQYMLDHGYDPCKVCNP